VPPIPRDIRRTSIWLVAAGVTAAALAALTAAALERVRFGKDDAAFAARVASDVQQQFDESANALRDLSGRLAAERDLVRSVGRDLEGVRRLFDDLQRVLPEADVPSIGVTIYDSTATPLAWLGRVGDLPRSRLEGGTDLFVATEASGPRLVYVQPLVDRARLTSRRVGTIVAEHVLGDLGAQQPGGSFVLSGHPVPVVLRPAAEPAAGQDHVFPIAVAGGSPIIQASVASADLSEARQQWRHRSLALVLAILSLTLVLSMAPVLELRAVASERRAVIAWTLVFVALLIAVRAMLSIAFRLVLGDLAAPSPFDLLADAAFILVMAWLALDLAERRRLAPRVPLLRRSFGAVAFLLAICFSAGLLAASALWGYERYLRTLVSRTGLDLLHFSLHPLSGSRAAVSFGLVLLHAGLIWSGALVLRLAWIGWRRPSRGDIRVLALVAIAAGLAGGAAAGRVVWGPIPLAPFLAATAASCACAAALARPRGPIRRASQGARLTFVYLAFLVPVVAMYPSVQTSATQAKEEAIAGMFAPAAQNVREDLRVQLYRTLERIDQMTDLPALLRAPGENDTPDSIPSFTVWSRTPLREHRVTSSIELYVPDGSVQSRLVSRFALNLPEYTSVPMPSTTCDWVLYEEVSSFTGVEHGRHVLRAARGICTGRGLEGTVVVRTMLDYGTLPFIAPQRPYAESFGSSFQPPAEGAPGRDIEFTAYGWSRAPLYTSSAAVWPLRDAVFEQLVGSREPLWTTIARDDGKVYRVYFLSDRGGIYALGYPKVTTFGHLVNIAELISLTLVVWFALVTGGTIGNLLVSRRAASGRALVRELRSSFYWKLRLAFVGMALLPVLILALAIRTYFASQFRASVEEDATRTATVAQRLVEDYATIGQRGPGRLEIVDDEVMLHVSQAIDQDVNLFDPKRLQASSERDLFASGALPLRTPGDVYRTLVIDQLPTFVGREASGGSPYLLAAAPVGQRQGIVTVPLTLREAEADQQIDNLDRQVLFASVLVGLLAGALGYWMAERIADPVSRLTRATRRIARGDLDARVAATSSDELRRLVEDFNHMAADLKRQRTELERTQRLEAWADMARQVAHDIKNPLTPIQLSAEHARRVNLDRGRPLSPILDECINAILGQVRLLRQIASEFSSFGSSPVAQLAAVDIGAVVDEVIEPYKTGLGERIDVRVEKAAHLPALMLDRTLITRALTNVIENALHAMPGDGTLAVATAAADGAVHVTVTDTGVGMDREALGRIFEPYFSTKATGTGLGLTIAKRNVELNGGTIEVASERGAGTTVTITLPTPSQSPHGAPDFRA
jgi:signal transduction histidine kinase